MKILSEKLIKSIFERKEESLTNSEENSRKIQSIRLSSKMSQLDSENMNLPQDPSSNPNTNVNFNNSRLRIDPSKLLNNITYTLNNVNTDLNMGYKKIYSFIDAHDISNQSNFYLIKPSINGNFMKEEIEKNKIERKVSKEVVEEIKSSQNAQEGNNKVACTCKKSKCLKLYCDCFANEGYCQNCNCVDCHNLEEYDSERDKAIQFIKEKNSAAFKPKIGLINNTHLKHTKGCNCTKSNCKKKYCECFQTGIECSDLCRCRDCKNVSRNKCNSYILYMNDNIGLNNQSIETPENASISFVEKYPKDSKSILDYQMNSQWIKPKPKNNVQINDFTKINIPNNSNIGIDFKNLFVLNGLNNNFDNQGNTLISKNKKTTTKSLTPKNRFTERKRGRKNIKTSKSVEPSKSLNKKDKDIMQMINNLNKASNLSKNLPIQVIPVQTIATPKKNSKLLMDINSNNTKSNHKSNNLKKNNIHKTFEKKYRDTTLTHIVTTAPTTSKKRTSTIFNKKDFDKNIVKKLNMNVNNEPLFDFKNKK